MLTGQKAHEEWIEYSEAHKLGETTSTEETDGNQTQKTGMEDPEVVKVCIATRRRPGINEVGIGVTAMIEEDICSGSLGYA